MLSEFREASRAHLARLGRLVDKESVPQLRRVYDDAAADLERKLAKAVGSGASPFTVHQHQVLLAQVRQGMARMSSTMGGALSAQTKRTQIASANAVIEDIKRLERASGASSPQLPIEQAARFTGVVDKRRTSLMALNKTSMARYGAGVVQQAESALSQALLTGETGFRAIDRVSKVVGGEWWRAERIVRTEGAWAYNATQMDAISATAPAFPDIMMRWTEMVADVSLMKLDPRVGDDSCAMHGQLARPGGSFGMPTDNPVNLKISASLLGKTWTNPPNRPNDRAVLQPWRPGWGWGWVLVGGGRGPAPTVRAQPAQAPRVPEVSTKPEPVKPPIKVAQALAPIGVPAAVQVQAPLSTTLAQRPVLPAPIVQPVVSPTVAAPKSDPWAQPRPMTPEDPDEFKTQVDEKDLQISTVSGYRITISRLEDDTMLWSAREIGSGKTPQAAIAATMAEAKSDAMEFIRELKTRDQRPVHSAKPLDSKMLGRHTEATLAQYSSDISYGYKGGQFTPSAQRAIRTQSVEVLGRYGLHDSIANKANRDQVHVKDRTEIGGVNAIFRPDGAIVLAKETAEGYAAFQKGDRSNLAMSRFRTIIHENVHAHGPRLDREPGRRHLEEAATEVVARRVVADYSEIDSTKMPGSYNELIDPIVNDIGVTAGVTREQAYKAFEHGALSIKSTPQSTISISKAITSIAENAANHLGITDPKKRKNLEESIRRTAKPHKRD